FFSDIALSGQFDAGPEICRPTMHGCLFSAFGSPEFGPGGAHQGSRWSDGVSTRRSPGLDRLSSTARSRSSTTAPPSRPDGPRPPTWAGGVMSVDVDCDGNLFLFSTARGGYAEARPSSGRSRLSLA